MVRRELFKRWIEKKEEEEASKKEDERAYVRAQTALANTNIEPLDTSKTKGKKKKKGKMK